MKRQTKIAKVPHRSKNSCTRNESLVREVHVLSVAFEQRNAAVTSDRVADRVAGKFAGDCDGNREPEAAQSVRLRSSAPATGISTSRPSARRNFPARAPRKSPTISVVIDQPDDGLLKMLHEAAYSSGRGGVSSRGAAQNFGGRRCPPSARNASKRSSGAMSRSPARSSARAMMRRTRGVIRMPSQTPVLAGAQRLRRTSACDFRNVDAVCIESAHDGGVALLEQGREQMLGADVVVAVVSALLLCHPKHAPRGWIKFGEQALGIDCNGRRKYRGDTI